MPTAERLANTGLKYNRFHTTALCAPTRQAMLTGRNHHSAGMGSITELATSAPGHTSIRPNTCALLPEVLRLNGYSTAQFGKCHEVPVWEISPVAAHTAHHADPYPRQSPRDTFYATFSRICARNVTWRFWASSTFSILRKLWPSSA